MILTDIIYIVMCCIFCTSGIMANILQVYAIRKSSPVCMKTYSLLLYNMAAVDLLSCCATFLTITSVLVTQTNEFLVYLGPLSYVSEYWCFIFYGISMYFGVYAHYVLTYSFVYRYYALKKRIPSSKFLQIFLILSLFIPLALTMYVEQARISKDDMEHLIDTYKPWREMENYTYSGVDLLSAPSIVIHVFLFSDHIPLYILIIYFRQNVYKILNDASQHLSPATLKANHQMMKAITVQACLPIFIGLAVSNYALMLFGVINSPILENSCVFLYLFPHVFSPLITLYYIKPYREILKRLIFQNAAAVKDSRTSSINTNHIL